MKTRNFCSPLEGRTLNMEEVPDEAFSSRCMGDGFAVELRGNEIAAPFDGIITAVYPTGHAVCMQGDDGIQVMIHAGLDSFRAEGLNQTLVTQGWHVRQGDLLVKTDVEKMKELGISRISPVVFLHQEKIILLKPHVFVHCREAEIIEITTKGTS